VYVTRVRTGTPRVARAPAEGGELEEVSKAYFRPAAISPDGQQLLGISWGEARRHASLATLPVAGGAVQLKPDLPVSAQWTPDGRRYVYFEQAGASAKVWVRPVADGSPRQIGPVVQDFVAALAISRDDRVAVSQGTQTTDVILISGAPNR